MTLLINGTRSIENPSTEAIAMELSSIPKGHEHFWSLYADGDTFIQSSGSLENGFNLEYKTGRASAHFSCQTFLEISEIIAVFQSFLRKDYSFSGHYKWSSIEARYKIAGNYIYTALLLVIISGLLIHVLKVLRH